MIVLGLLLIAVSAVVGVELFVSNNQTEVVGEAFGRDITHLSAAGYGLLFNSILVVLFFGVLLVDSGLRRTRKRKAEREEFEARQVEAARQAQWEKSAAITEAERLREELVEERMAQATLGGVVPPPDPTRSAAPVDPAPVEDPEHAESDHRGVLGRIRHDREELPDTPAAPLPPAPAPVRAPAAKAAKPAPAKAAPAKAAVTPPPPPAKAPPAPRARAAAAPPPPPAGATRPMARAGVTPQRPTPRKAGAPAGPPPPAPQTRTESGTPVPRPEAATDAFNAALAPAVERERPPAE